MSRSAFSLSIICFASAQAIFFGQSQEPPFNMGLILLLVALIALMHAHLTPWDRLQKTAWLFLVFAIGFGWAQFMTLAQLRGTGQPPVASGEQNVQAIVKWSEWRSRGSLVDVELRDETGRAYGVRLYGKQDMAAQLLPGCAVNLTADLSPLPLPSVIGGYDPRFVAWFEGRRGQGFIREVQAHDCSIRPNLKQRVARWRLAIAVHYRAAMSPDSGPVAAALITGVRGAINKPVREAFRQSGLAHMLAISGLHMALFAGSLYALLRYGAALWPRLVLRYDVRKPSAIIALMAATGYLFLSGASFATQRAYIMLAIFFLAVLLDRPAITMRNVLWAIVFVLLIQPQAVVQVGFQMSFAAVMALVSAYEIWQRRDRFYMRLADMSPRQRAVHYARRYGAALFVTSAIAGTVTGVVAILHFYRIGVMGLPANLLAMPIFGTLIMPMAPLSLLAWPLGGDGPFIAIMQTGISAIIGLAQWLTGFNGAVRHFGASPDWVLPVMAVGFVYLCLRNGRWRLLGLLPVCIGLLAIGNGERPLLHFIGRDLIVANDHAGDLHVLRNRQSDFALRRVAAFHGLPKPPDMDCEKGCGLLGHDRRVVAYLTSPKRLTVACRNSDIVTLPFATAKYPCAAMLIDETFLQRDTPMQIIARGRHLHIKKAADGRLWQK